MTEKCLHVIYNKTLLLCASPFIYAKNDLYLNFFFFFLKDTLIQLGPNTETEIYLNEQFCIMAQWKSESWPLYLLWIFGNKKINS